MSGGLYPSGSMSSQGTTTPVFVNFAEVDKADRKILCSAICQCKETPGLSKDGRSLKQICVSNQLRDRDEELGYRSHYKPEINYDMTKNPPAPIMDKEEMTKGHRWLPGWIRKRWDSDPEHPPFQAGQGMVLRPDVIIVKDPEKPPTQDNIKQAVEIKFKDDVWGKNQERGYRLIAGPNKLAELTPQKCGCEEPAPRSAADEESKAEKGIIDYIRDFVDAADDVERRDPSRGRTQPKRLPRK